MFYRVWVGGLEILHIARTDAPEKFWPQFKGRGQVTKRKWKQNRIALPEQPFEDKAFLFCSAVSQRLSHYTAGPNKLIETFYQH